MMKQASLIAAAGLVLAACQTTDPYTGEQKTSNTARGAVIGALAGTAVGALTNTSDGEQAAKNAMIGAGVGALGGAAIGRYMDNQEAELREQLEGTGVSVTRSGDNIVLNMPGDVTFDLGSANLNSDFYPVLTDVGVVLNKYEQTIVNVDGHTDTSGAADLNADLSQERANGVARYIIEQGIMPQRFIVTGFGESRPKVATGDGVKEAMNRRVEIWLSPLTQ